MSDTKTNPQQQAMHSAALMSAIAQLEMMINAMGNAPDRVKLAAQEFRDALKEWAGNA